MYNKRSIKQLDLVLLISRMTMVSRRLRLITLTLTLINPVITKTESNNLLFNICILGGMVWFIIQYGIKAENLDVIFHKVSIIFPLYTYCPYMGN